MVPAPDAAVRGPRRSAACAGVSLPRVASSGERLAVGDLQPVGPLAERAYGAAMRSGWLAIVAAAVGIVGCGRAAPHASSTVRSSSATVPAFSDPGSGALRFVRLRIEGRPYVFLVDTGAGRTVVDASVARALHLRLVGAEHRSPTLGCRAATQGVRVVDWEIAGRRLPALTVTSQTLSDLKIGVVRLGGLLGADVLSRFGTVTLGFASRRVVLGGPPPPGARSIPFAVLRRNGSQLITVRVAVNGTSTGWVVDTGASSTVIAASQLQRLSIRQVGPRGRAYGATGCPIRVTPVGIRAWRAGDVQLPATTALSSRSSVISRPLGTATIAGLIGSDVLASFGSVTIDFTHRRLILGNPGR
jgi:predicted aspartyl protease